MSMLAALETNLGMSIEYLVLIVFLCGNLVFYAVNFKKGIIMQFLGSGLLFMLFYHYEMLWMPFVVILFISLIIMSFSLYAIRKTALSPGGGFI